MVKVLDLTIVAADYLVLDRLDRSESSIVSLPLGSLLPQQANIDTISQDGGNFS